MKPQRIVCSLAVVSAWIGFAGCGGMSSGNGNMGVGGAPGVGGNTASGMGGATGSGGATTGPGGAGSGGAGLGGNGAAGSGNGGRGGRAGSGAGGSAAGGAGMTGGTTGGGASGEDEGTDCTVAALPDSAGLPTIAKLPDPFKKLDGTRMTTKAEWRCRREEIRKLAEKFAYGTKPAKPQMVTGTVSNTSITVSVMDNGKSTTFNVTVALPTGGSRPYPSIIQYTSAPLDSATINSEGVAVINYNPFDVGKEGTGRANKQGAFYDIAGSNSTTGLLVAWGWGVSRIIDVIAQSDGTLLRADAVAVTGCSRFGKGAFIAGAFDQRVALTMPIESGTAGVPIWRNVNQEGAQTLSSAFGEQPWFGDAFSAFTGAPTKAPLDTHETIAMIAPRGLFIMDNPHIANLGPISAHAASMAGAEVYKALGAGANITYYSDVQNGTHCSMRPEWVAPLKSNIEAFLKKTGAPAGVIRASASATAREADWVDWTTPTLN